LPSSSFSFSFSFSSSRQSSEQLVRRLGLDHFVERERLTLTAWLPARPRLQVLPQAKITFGEK
jgi:hypothetical protein